jgi:hypothetical protein
LERLGLPVDSLERAPGGKLILPVIAPREPAPLKWVIGLTRDPPPSRRAITGGVALALLAEHTFRSHYIAALGMAAGHFRMICRVATLCHCATISRNCGVAALADALTAMHGGG